MKYELIRLDAQTPVVFGIVETDESGIITGYELPDGEELKEWEDEEDIRSPFLDGEELKPLIRGGIAAYPI
jgi:hypothetical protein